MITIGVDPGKSGAIAFFDGKNILAIHRNTESAFEIYMNFKRELKNLEDYFALIEKVSSMPGEGVTSSFAFGRSFGHLEMLLAVFQIPHQFISPNSWMAKFVPNRPKGKKGQDKPQLAKVRAERKRYIRDEVLRRCPFENTILPVTFLAITDADACALAILAWNLLDEDKKNRRLK
jgi:hypothetical protein